MDSLTYTPEDLEYELANYVFSKLERQTHVQQISEFINYLKDPES